MKTKIFCDSADYKTIRKLNKNKIVSGFTTNPSLMRNAGAKSYKLYSQKILKICNKKPISFEVFADDKINMLKQAYIINDWGKNVFVKIPVVNSKGKFMGEVIKELSSKGIKLNITAVYTFDQVKRIFKMLDIRVFSEQRKNRAVVDNPSLRPCFSRCYLAAQDFSSFRSKGAN